MADNGGGKNKKYGRNAQDCTRYKMENRLEKNKKRRLARHLRMVEKRAERVQFRKAHNGMTPAQYAGAMKHAPRWEAA